MAGSIWDVQFPVDFTPEGDETEDAVWKHINEIGVIYGHLNDLKTNGKPGRQGDPGPPGEPGADGAPGADGTDGADGKSAYEVAVSEGFEGTEDEWLASLVGEKGERGPEGVGIRILGVVESGGDVPPTGVPGDAYLVGTGAPYNLYVWDDLGGAFVDTGTIASGPPGTDGTDGADGADGADGKSAYEIAVDEGFEGTEDEWLASLVGAKGDPGKDGKDGGDDRSNPAIARNWSMAWPTSPHPELGGEFFDMVYLDSKGFGSMFLAIGVGMDDSSLLSMYGSMDGITYGWEFPLGINVDEINVIRVVNDNIVIVSGNTMLYDLVDNIIPGNENISSDFTLIDIAYGNGVYAALCRDGANVPQVLVSDDISKPIDEWTPHSLGVSNSYLAWRICFGQLISDASTPYESIYNWFLVLLESAEGVSKYTKSNDGGATWTVTNFPPAMGAVYDICFWRYKSYNLSMGGEFVAVGDSVATTGNSTLLGSGNSFDIADGVSPSQPLTRVCPGHESIVAASVYVEGRFGYSGEYAFSSGEKWIKRTVADYAPTGSEGESAFGGVLAYGNGIYVSPCVIGEYTLVSPPTTENYESNIGRRLIALEKVSPPICSTTDITAGSTPLATGKMYLVYE